MFMGKVKTVVGSGGEAGNSPIAVMIVVYCRWFLSGTIQRIRRAAELHPHFMQ